MKPSQRLEMLGLELGAPRAPKGAYVGARSVSDLLFVSGQTCDQVQGIVGYDVSAEIARIAARDAALNCLQQAAAVVGDVDRLAGPVKLVGFICALPSFHAISGVIDGASELLSEVFDNAGHARLAIGVASLPGGACVEVEMVLGLAQEKGTR